MPAHFVGLATGHYIKTTSAMFDCFEPERTGLHPSSIYQGVDAPVTLGRMGTVRVPESLTYLPKNVQDMLPQILDDMTQIDESTHTSFQQDGQLCQALKNGLAK